MFNSVHNDSEELLETFKHLKGAVARLEGTVEPLKTQKIAKKNELEDNLTLVLRLVCRTIFLSRRLSPLNFGLHLVKGEGHGTCDRKGRLTALE